MNKMQLLNMIGDLVRNAQEYGEYTHPEDKAVWQQRHDELSHALFDAVATSDLPEGAYDVPVYAVITNQDKITGQYEMDICETLTGNVVETVETYDPWHWCGMRYIAIE